MTYPTTERPAEQPYWPWTPPQAPQPQRPARRRAGRTAALVAAVAVVSGATGGGVVALVDGDEPAATPPAATSTVSNVADRSTSAGEALDIRGILAKIEPATVTVRTRALAPDAMMQPVAAEGAGTGFIVRADGVIVTNSHVVENATSITVTMSDGETMPAQVLGRSASEDLAVLKVDAEDLPVAELGESGALQVGDPVVAIGNALGLPGGPTVTEGIVSALDRTIGTDRGARLENLIQTDAAINPGNSGGPLVDGQGRVIGINTAGATDGQNIGFAISIDGARSVIDDLAAGRTITKPFVGVQTAPVNEAVRQQFGLGVDSGALVMGVTPGSPAESAGVRAGDVIVGLGGEEVSGPDDLAGLLDEREPGDVVEVELARGGSTTTVEVTLGSRADS